MTEEKEEKKAEKPKKKEPVTEEMIQKSNEAAERLEKANEEHTKLMEEQKAANVEKNLAGEADAAPDKELTEAEQLTKDAKKVLEGTGFEDRI